MASSTIWNVKNWGWGRLIFCLALALRLWGVNWQLPALLYPDEGKYVEWAAAVADDRPLDHTDFRNPSLYRHLLLLEYRASEALAPLSDARSRAVRRTVLARVTSAVMGAGAAALTGLAAARLFSPLARCNCGTHLAIGPSSRCTYPISPLTTVRLFSFSPLAYILARASAFGRVGSSSCLPVCAGLAAAGKYTFGVVGAIPLLVLAVDVARRRIGLPLALGLMSLTALAGVVGLLAAMPEIVTATSAVGEGILQQATKGQRPSGLQQESPVIQLYLESSVRGLGLPAMVFALLGATQLVAVSRFRALILLTCPLIYLAVMLRSELFAARFALPLLPFAAILAASGVLSACNLWRSVPARRSSIALSLLAIALPASAAVIQHNTLATTRDTRLVARDWLRDHASRFNVAVQFYGLPFGYSGQDSPATTVSVRFIRSGRRLMPTAWRVPGHDLWSFQTSGLSES